MSETVTSKDVCEAAGISIVTAHRWAKEGVLPTPTKTFLGRRGTVAQWPAYAVKQARWVRSRLDAKQSFQQIREALSRGEFQPEPDSSSD